MRLPASACPGPPQRVWSFRVPDGWCSIGALAECDSLARRWHIHPAAIYRDEREVGAVIAESGVPRDEIYVETRCR